MKSFLILVILVAWASSANGRGENGLDSLFLDPNMLNSLMSRRYVPEVDQLDNGVDPEIGDAYQPQENSRMQMDDLLMGRDSPISIRDQEYLEHLSVPGHLFMQGGAGEGHQHLKPDGSMPNVQVVKTDAILPAYCNPPNPCPIGYSAGDECLEEFENTAAFSRDHQSKQQCMCDREHMFDCPGATEESELDTLARSMSNSELSDTFDKIANTLQDVDDPKDHKVVAKKFFTKKAAEEQMHDGEFEMSKHSRYAAREKKGSYHSSLPWIEDSALDADFNDVTVDRSAKQTHYSFV